MATFSFRNLKTRKELALLLQCEEAALDYVELCSPLRICKKPSCLYYAANHNHGYCVCCSKNWYPRIHTNREGEVTKADRGHLLLGNEFRESTSKNSHSCCCQNPTCIGLGYSRSVFAFPTDQQLLKKWFEAAGSIAGMLPIELRKRIEKEPRKFFLLYWHFDPSHLEFDESRGRWVFKRQESYFDADGKKWKTPNHPPPNYVLEKFKEVVEVKKTLGPKDRWMDSNALPRWVNMMRRVETSATTGKENDPSVSNSPPKKKARTSSSSNEGCVDRPVTRQLEAELEAKKLEKELVDAKSQIRAETKKNSEHQQCAHDRDVHYYRAVTAARVVNELQEQLDEARRELRVSNEMNSQLKEYIETLESEIRDLKAENAEYKMQIDRLSSHLEEALSRKVVLSYDSLRPGGLLGNYVKDFTYFPTFEANEAFLEVINFADGSDGACSKDDGMCENLFRYTNLSIDDRKKAHGLDGESTNEAAQPHDEATRRSSCKLHYKTEWLVYCVYAHSGWTERQIAPLFDVCSTTVHNIVYIWANLLNDVLSAWFPIPTRSQLLRAYPVSLFYNFGDCRVHTILDACEVWSQMATRLAVHEVLFSVYKNHDTLKFLAGCDGIGTTWSDIISKGFPGAISDPVFTKLIKILLTIPFGMSVEADKGFLVNNEAAQVGVGIARPPKLLKHQTQQSLVDAAETEKIGHTRIPIEQLNGACKAATRYFMGDVPILQLGLASLLFRVSYLLQNFKPGFTQNRCGNEAARPCRAEIRWYGATEEGLMDARPYPDLWATEREKAVWHELRRKHTELSDTEISELVLEMNIPEQLRKEHARKLAQYNRKSN